MRNDQLSTIIDPIMTAHLVVMIYGIQVPFHLYEFASYICHDILFHLKLPSYNTDSLWLLRMVKQIP